MSSNPWKVSLHGGHSRGYCDHAFDPLRSMLDAAVEQGYHTFGVSEHAPRLDEQYLYENEIEMGWTVAKIERDFEAYCKDIVPIAEEYAGRLVVLRGFETESAPCGNYFDLMRQYRARPCFEYCVGSVHFLKDISIDGPRKEFELALEAYGSLEALAVAYYKEMGDMVEALKPEVVGHFDLIRKNGHFYGPLDTPAIVDAALASLEIVRKSGSILDLNTAGYRKGLDTPYPEPWLVQAAHELGIGFCFGDDSHSVAHVGAGIDDARAYLRNNGVDTVTVLTKDDGEVVKKVVPLPGD